MCCLIFTSKYIFSDATTVKPSQNLLECKKKKSPNLLNFMQGVVTMYCCKATDNMGGGMIHD